MKLQIFAHIYFLVSLSVRNKFGKLTIYKRKKSLDETRC